MESLESDVEVYCTLPERVLLAAVLEMSVRDLLYGTCPELKKEALNWILYEWRLPRVTPCFSFTDCIEYLDLSGKQINFLVESARLAEAEYDKARHDKKEMADAESVLQPLAWPCRWRRVRYTGPYAYKLVLNKA